MKHETFASEGGKGVGGRSMNQQIVEIMVCMQESNNYVSDAGSVIAFRGAVALSVSQSFFLTLCAAIGLASLVLLFQIRF